MKLYRHLKLSALAAAALVSVASAQAGLVSVDAALNSVSGGTGLAALDLVQGQSFSLSANPLDIWSAGSLRGNMQLLNPGERDTRNVRVSTQTLANANGLTATSYALAGDDSGFDAGTVIGRNFGLFSDGGFDAPYAALVGQIGDGDFFLVGTSYSGIAASSGTLKLYFWDANATDNFGAVQVQASADALAAVPEPQSAALVGLALGALALSRRRPARV